MILHVETKTAPAGARALCSAVVWLEVEPAQRLGGEVVMNVGAAELGEDERRVFGALIAQGLRELADNLKEQGDGEA